MKQFGVGSEDQGGGKRRAGTLKTLAKDTDLA
jgi:hypothetical protein